MSDPMSSSQSTTDLAKERAAGVGSSAKESAQQVAGTATEQAGQVASEVTAQARNLVGEATSSAREQANAQRDKAVGGLRSLGTELSGMADKSEESGLAAELARQASERAHQVADFLDGREPGDLLEDVRDLARRRPGTFLIGAAVAGVLAGRLTRGAVSAAKSDDSGSDGYAAGAVDTGYDAGYGAGYGSALDVDVPPAVPATTATPGPYTTEVEPGPYETTHGIDATGVREPSAGPLSGGGYEGRP
jgi:vacuolar-type H+-ATPase subunit H